MIINLLLWALPILIIPASYVFSRYIPWRKGRYYFYTAVLAAAFCLNLFGLSFHCGMYDRILLLGINFILAEFIWNFSRKRKKRLLSAGLALAVVSALCLFNFDFPRWLTGGCGNAWGLWNDTVASTYRMNGSVYSLSDRDLFDVKHPARLLILSKKIGAWPFERKISHPYHTLDGFYRTAFICKWSNNGAGVRLDLYVPGFDRQIWTMGEGF